MFSVPVRDVSLVGSCNGLQIFSKNLCHEDVALSFKEHPDSGYYEKVRGATKPVIDVNVHKMSLEGE